MIKISEYYCKDDWQSKVYKPRIENYDRNSPEWVSIRTFIHIQQKGKCARCRKKIDSDLLTIHHIIPRSKGGTNDIENLIGLCYKCHNIIEPKKLDREEITNYYKRRKRKEKSKENNWHLWVYGGFSRFLKNEKKIIIKERKEEKYSYPKNIVLHKEILGERTINVPPVSKTIKKAKMLKPKKLIKKKISYIKMFGRSKKRLSIIFKVTELTISKWVKDESTCRKMNYLLGRFL